MSKHQPLVNWPRPYLLEIYERATTEGCCRVEAIGGAQRADSLIKSFYRLRRRGDSAHKLNFIKPSYHLVMADYEPERDSVLFVFDSLPDGLALPEIASVPEAERRQLPQPRQHVEAAQAAAEAELDDAGIDAAIEELARRSAGKGGTPGEL